MKKHFKLQLPDQGMDIYAPCERMTWGYRYGPSIMVHDGICEAWFASPGAVGEADWFTYKKSTDGGRTWSPEVVVLMPTADSMDWFSVCDPAVIKYGGYYYIGYTSTVFSHAGGVCNNAFVARSKHAEGPYEKWTGNGWGEHRGDLHWIGKPAPIVYFDEPWQRWGAGEPSFVVKDDVLYMYFTWTSTRADGSFYHMTRVATADITREDWPATLEYRGVAVMRSGGSNDSFDVVYCEDLDKFVAISTDKRFTEDSMLAIYESDDGLTFRRVNEIRVNTSFMCHNSGISGDCLHHIKSGDLMLLAYAYGNQWGKWGTRLHRYDFLGMDEDFYSETDQPNVARALTCFPSPDPIWPIAITGDPHVYRVHLGETVKIHLIWLDTCYRQYPLEEGVVFSGYDREIISVDGMTVRGEKLGYTYLDASYAGRTLQIPVIVYPADVDFSEDNKCVIGFRPVVTEYFLNATENELKQIRGIADYANGSWFEIGGDTDPCVTYENDAPDVVNVDSNGYVTFAGKEGRANITVRCGEFAFDVTVTAGKR